jgi:hypothetical protein
MWMADPWPSRLLKNVHLLRCPHPSSLRRTGLYVSFLGISVALHLSVFEQPARRGFFFTLPVKGFATVFVYSPLRHRGRGGESVFFAFREIPKGENSLSWSKNNSSFNNEMHQGGRSFRRKTLTVFGSAGVSRPATGHMQPAGFTKKFDRPKNLCYFSRNE